MALTSASCVSGGGGGGAAGVQPARKTARDTAARDKCRACISILLGEESISITAAGLMVTDIRFAGFWSRHSLRICGRRLAGVNLEFINHVLNLGDFLR